MKVRKRFALFAQRQVLRTVNRGAEIQAARVSIAIQRNCQRTKIIAFGNQRFRNVRREENTANQYGSEREGEAQRVRRHKVIDENQRHGKDQCDALHHPNLQTRGEPRKQRDRNADAKCKQRGASLFARVAEHIAVHWQYQTGQHNRQRIFRQRIENYWCKQGIE
jgi:hypothetical protein